MLPSVFAPRAAAGVAGAAGRAGRLFDRLTAAALADKTAGRHALAHLLAAAALTVGLFFAEYQTLEIHSTLFTVVLVDGHI